MMTFCTLFDSYYLDKGIALYRSLEKVSQDFTLYIFCFDERSYEILTDMNLRHAVILRNSCFETPELLKLKQERSKAEYCWTCTPVTIEYVLQNYDVDSCTYIDADLYFYKDPSVLFAEMAAHNADATIVEHRFQNDALGRKLEERSGKYCVQFNHFRKNENGQKVLGWWRDKCFEWCYDIAEPDRMGDQKYLNQFTTLFEGVHELQHQGGGVAPWNLRKYSIVSASGNDIMMRDAAGEDFPLVFYHFQNIRYMPGRKVNIKSQTRDKKLKYAIYVPYLKEIEGIRQMLVSQYGFHYNLKQIALSSNPVLGFLQKHFASLKVRHLSDIMDLNKLDVYLK